ncbi:hypothetical protein GL2_33420 [Microbulbifer sp. GL-2]|nr:hypothetical protein GL2_33420 [Microbulbifer sp. GL-2]
MSVIKLAIANKSTIHFKLSLSHLNWPAANIPHVVMRITADHSEMFKMLPNRFNAKAAVIIVTAAWTKNIVSNVSAR